MKLHTDDLSGQAAQALALAGGLAAATGSRLDDVTDRLADAGGRLAETGGRYGAEAGDRVGPVARSTARTLAEHRLLVAILGVTLVALLLAAQRRRHRRNDTERRLHSVTSVSEPAPAASR